MKLQIGRLSEATQWMPTAVWARHIFVARRARQVGSLIADDLEEQSLLLLNRAEIERALTAGAFRVLPWAAQVALGLRLLDQL